MRTLIDNAADINVKNQDGDTSLYMLFEDII
jgi:hypothetical protein